MRNNEKVNATTYRIRDYTVLRTVQIGLHRYSLNIRVASQRKGAQQHILMNKGSRMLPVTEPTRPKVMISSRIIVLERLVEMCSVKRKT